MVVYMSCEISPPPSLSLSIHIFHFPLSSFSALALFLNTAKRELCCLFFFFCNFLFILLYRLSLSLPFISSPEINHPWNWQSPWNGNNTDLLKRLTKKKNSITTHPDPFLSRRRPPEVLSCAGKNNMKTLTFHLNPIILLGPFSVHIHLTNSKSRYVNWIQASIWLQMIYSLLLLTSKGTGDLREGTKLICLHKPGIWFLPT